MRIRALENQRKQRRSDVEDWMINVHQKFMDFFNTWIPIDEFMNMPPLFIMKTLRNINKRINERKKRVKKMRRF